MMCYNSGCLPCPLSQSYEIKARPMIPKNAFLKKSCGTFDWWSVEIQAN